MKRTIPILLILFAVLCSCSQTTDPADLFSVPMTVTATLDGSNAQFTADIFQDGCDIVFAEGHALSGTVLRFRTDGNTASVGDTFTRDIKQGIFPAQEAFIKAIRLLSDAEENGVFDGEVARYTIDEMTIMVYYDKNTDSITRIETEEDGRRFGFSIAAFKPYEAQSNSDDTA